MKKIRYVKWAAFMLLIAGFGAAIWFFMSHTGTPKESSGASETGSASGSSYIESKEEEKKFHSSALEDKSETVYAKADAEGTITEITVEDILKNPGGNNPLSDYSTLKDIKSTEGDEEYTQEADGTILWDNHGEDISYKGTSGQELPVSVKISYWLDDQPIKPGELAGKSGHLRMRFDYENHTSETITIDGREVEVQIPFTVLSAMFLPTDVFYNIEVDNGKVISMGDQNMVVGYACPGLLDSLKLKDYEPTEDVEIPDYVELTADVSRFELEFTATIITSGMFKDMDMEDLHDADDLINDMKELTDASEELTDGVGELLDGVIELRDGIKEYVDGVRAVDEGVAAVKDSLDILDDQKVPLREGASALQSGLEALDTALGQSAPDGGSDLFFSQSDMEAAGTSMTSALQALGNEAESLFAALSSLQESYGNETPPSEISDMTDTLANIQQQLEALNENAGHLSAALTGISDLTNALSTLQSTVHQLANGSKQLSEGVGAYTHSVSELYRGSLELSDGAAELAEAGDELNDGLAGLADGVQELKDGVEEFDEEGIQNLADLAGDDLAAVIRSVRALKEADSHYQNFSGIYEGQTGNVKFIIETDEISSF